MAGTVAAVSRRRRRKSLSRRFTVAAILLTACVCTGFITSRLFPEDNNRSRAAATVSKLQGRDASPFAKEEDPNTVPTEIVGEVPCGEVEAECEENVATQFDKILWVFLYSLATLFVFLALAIVCDDFFVASLEVICDELKLTPDVAGATFMAAGSSAPELFTSVVGVFYEKNDVGIGTILGSAVFNILVIIGLTALLAGQALQLDWKPLARDAMFYLFSIILMILMFRNHRIDWYEAVILLVCYGLYLVIMKNNDKLMSFLERISNSQPSSALAEDKDEATSSSAPSFRVVAHMVVANIRFQKSAQAAKERMMEELEEEEEDEGDLLDFPDNAKDQLLWVIALPIILAFKLTIPDCSNEKYRKYYMVTFLMSIFWIGLACFFMADWARALGCILNISPAIMGLTLLAAGTSVPDALASLFVAQDGEGDMAISNAIGSNVFDVLLGLGLPWTIAIAMQKGEPVHVCSQGVVKATVMLFLVLVFVVGTLAFFKWELTPRVGAAMFAMYFVFIIFSLVDEYTNLVHSP